MILCISAISVVTFPFSFLILLFSVFFLFSSPHDESGDSHPTTATKYSLNKNITSNYKLIILMFSKYEKEQESEFIEVTLWYASLLSATSILFFSILNSLRAHLWVTAVMNDLATSFVYLNGMRHSLFKNNN